MTLILQGGSWTNKYPHLTSTFPPFCWGSPLTEHDQKPKGEGACWCHPGRSVSPGRRGREGTSIRLEGPVEDTGHVSKVCMVFSIHKTLPHTPSPHTTTLCGRMVMRIPFHRREGEAQRGEVAQGHR